MSIKELVRRVKVDLWKKYESASMGGPNEILTVDVNMDQVGKQRIVDEHQMLPRFQPENLDKNALIFERVNEMATKKGCTPSQLALAWVHHQGSDVCPIPGTTKIENLNQNIGALSVKLTPEEMAELESFASADVVKGERHGQVSGTWRESETQPLSSWKTE